MRSLAIAALVASMGVASAARADAHPLHTTLTELTIVADGSARIVLRAFIDDFSAAVMEAPVRRSAMPTPPDSAIARYLSRTLVMTDGSGRRVPLAILGTRRTGDLVWVTLRSPAMLGPAGRRLTNSVLFERWDDQVNIVQTTLGTQRRTLLFTRRDGETAKAI